VTPFGDIELPKGPWDDGDSGRYYILGADGRTPVKATLREWGEWFQGDPQRRILSRSKIPGGYVSTVFLGLDHGWDGGPPVLWETLVFGGPEDGFMDRYRSWRAWSARNDGR
jgi:hypothetical protein